jgi:hypothetical protein
LPGKWIFVTVKAALTKALEHAMLSTEDQEAAALWNQVGEAIKVLQRPGARGLSHV